MNGTVDDPGKRYRDGYFNVRDGLVLHYRDYLGSADRPPLLCLHGLTRNARDFADFAERHSPRFRVIALDFRGRGESDYDPIPARYVPLTYAYDVIELLDELKLSKAIFVGTSLGGLVTMAIAGIDPIRVAGSILNDVGPELNRAGLDKIRSYVGKSERFHDWDEAAAALEKVFGGSFDRYTHSDWVRMAKRNCREDNAEIVFDYDPAIALPFNAPLPETPFDWWPLYLVLAEKPLLVLRGANSDLLTAGAAGRMVAAAPGVDLVTVAHAGHAPELNEPEAVEAIDAFLAGVAP
jgi:pimeloyl-ACP methyl ester carboxylesterase